MSEEVDHTSDEYIKTLIQDAGKHLDRIMTDERVRPQGSDRIFLATHDTMNNLASVLAILNERGEVGEDEWSEWHDKVCGMGQVCSAHKPGVWAHLVHDALAQKEIAEEEAADPHEHACENGGPWCSEVGWHLCNCGEYFKKAS